MKKCFIGIGKAALYFFVYMGCQLLCTFAIALAIAVILALQMAGGNMNAVEYITAYTNLVNQSTYYILIASAVLNLLVYWIIMLIRKKKLYQEVSIRKMKPWIVVPVLIGGIVVNFVLSALISVIPFTEAMMASYESKSSILMGGGVAMWIATVVAAPVVEEIVFRGLVYSRLKSGMNRWVAAIITSMVFGAAHGTFIWAVYTFIFSMILIFILERSGSLLACILFHMAFNFVGSSGDIWGPWLENVSDMIIVLGSVVIMVIVSVWFIRMTKKKKAIVSVEEGTYTEV